MQDHAAIHLQKISASSAHFFSQRYYLYSSITKKKSIQDYWQHNYFHSKRILREIDFLQILHWLKMKHLNHRPIKTEQLSKRLEELLNKYKNKQ